MVPGQWGNVTLIYLVPLVLHASNLVLQRYTLLFGPVTFWLGASMLQVYICIYIWFKNMVKKYDRQNENEAVEMNNLFI